MRGVRVVVLEGPVPVAGAATALQEAVALANRALWHVTCGYPGARARFDEAHEAFRRALERFIEAAGTPYST